MPYTPAMGAPHAFHVLTKPVGPICNLDCHYCFYLEKEKLYPGTQDWRMNGRVLEEYVRQYIAQQPGSQVHFAWQGGEPTLLGVSFFRDAVELQQRYANGKRISNSLQTNGVLLDGEWCEFLREQRFLVGISIDGPRELHDKYRLDKQGRGSFDAVIRGLELLKKHRVDFNTLTVVNRANQDRPLEVYRFLKEIGSQHLQLIPLVERNIAGRRVDPHRYGEFLCAIFDEWVLRDVGRIFVQMFDVALENWMGLGSSLCVFAEKCGAALAIEHNGDLYSCDHFVDPEYRLGNVLESPLGDMVQSAAQRRFGDDKLDRLPAYCRRCDVRFACNGECPKNRFVRTPDGEEGLNYLCPAYKRFFTHIDPPMRLMADLLRQGRAAAEIMQILHRDRALQQAASAGRNDPCPCGSGRKFKKCCGAANMIR